MSYASDALIDAQEREIGRLETENDALKGAMRELGRLCDDYHSENAALRELARTNWFIALSERDALRIHGVNPDGGAYITALDATMDESRETMQHLGIEVE